MKTRAATAAALLSFLASESHTSTPQPFDQPVREVELVVRYEIRPRGPLRRIVLRQSSPRDIHHRQRVIERSFSRAPSAEFEAEGESYAEFLFEDLSGPVSFEARYLVRLERDGLAKARVRLREGERAVAAGAEGKGGAAGAGGAAGTGRLSLFSLPEPYIESDAQEIVGLAQRMRRPADTETLHDLHQFVIRRLAYHGYNPDSVGATETLRRGGGDCTEYADLFVALARASGFPARVLTGVTVEDADTVKHNWAEVWIEDFGWVPFDPLHAQRLPSTNFEVLDNKYIVLSHTRTDARLNGFSFYSYEYLGARPEVVERYEFRER
ncbi:MAG: transglutaminase domain-containing protein [Candidatus Sumerlaeia bacterium]|nr:transglutaminase domain-containing protein [Candidatus Sumerlaeia bacterium]